MLYTSAAACSLYRIISIFYLFIIHRSLVCWLGKWVDHLMLSLEQRVLPLSACCWNPPIYVHGWTQHHGTMMQSPWKTSNAMGYFRKVEWISVLLCIFVMWRQPGCWWRSCTGFCFSNRLFCILFYPFSPSSIVFCCKVWNAFKCTFMLVSWSCKLLYINYTWTSPWRTCFSIFIIFFHIKELMVYKCLSLPASLCLY